ncbi:hypothetical protein CEXT_79801 [Caerostris extrusa]|uniref:Uncharacterized protein n=1 Tax=Caerostris extrusa TaxID=172846 RepID=A0AAV4T7R9_CAEEX|nr:hypothetical protein CEXT_79801 [Caerostris extrusa]
MIDRKLNYKTERSIKNLRIFRVLRGKRSLLTTLHINIHMSGGGGTLTGLPNRTSIEEYCPINSTEDRDQWENDKTQSREPKLQPPLSPKDAENSIKEI